MPSSAPSTFCEGRVGVGDVCAEGQFCGSGSPCGCHLSATGGVNCIDASATSGACTVDEDCPSGEACMQAGSCSPNGLCFQIC